RRRSVARVRAPRSRRSRRSAQRSAGSRERPRWWHAGSRGDPDRARAGRAGRTVRHLPAAFRPPCSKRRLRLHDSRGGVVTVELAYRESDGVEVMLVWDKAADSVKVAVFDSRTDEAFEVPVGEASPLDVFNHPFAYAAFQLVEAA